MNRPLATSSRWPSSRDQRVRFGRANGFWTTILAATLWLPGSAFLQAAQPAAPKPVPAVPGAQPPRLPAAAQPNPKAKPAAVPAVPAKPKTAEKEKPAGPPAPETNWLETKDGWRIHCLYYPPQPDIRKGKETIPIILLHGWQGQGGEYAFLATGLQTFGHAVAVPDLRGHGRSTSRRNRDGDLETAKIDDPRKFTPVDLKAIVNDVEEVKKMLMKKNNAAEVNIELLTVGGAEFGCALAMNWAAADWSFPDTPALKQGRDVKALILLSPAQRISKAKGYDCSAALSHPAIENAMSLLIAVGEKDRKASSEARRIFERFEKIRPKPAKDKTPEERLQKQDLFYFTAPTDLQGTKLLDRELPINRRVVDFLKLRLLNRLEEPELAWRDRRGPGKD